MSRYKSWLETIIGDIYLKELKTEEEINNMTKFILSLVYIYSYNALEKVK